MLRREAEIGLRDRECHQRPKERNDAGEDPDRNGPFRVGLEIRSFEGLDGEGDLDQTGCFPRRDRTSLRTSSQERNFLLRRPGGEMGSFASIAGAETRQPENLADMSLRLRLFEIAALLRASDIQYNYRVWAVETIGTKLPAPHAGIEPVSEP
jgi:hypothetical protein